MMYKVEYDNQVGWIEYNYENFNSSSEENIPDEITDELVEDDKEETIITRDSDASNDNGIEIYPIDRLSSLGLVNTAMKSIMISSNANSRSDKYVN